jgi:hypothetical protein
MTLSRNDSKRLPGRDARDIAQYGMAWRFRARCGDIMPL